MNSLPPTSIDLSSNSNVVSLSKKERIGRWTGPQAYLFETLLERYGKNWKKIHLFMKGRSLSQIRSHGQKYFAKIGSKKLDELERRAKILEAYETLESQKRLQEEIIPKQQISEEKSISPQIKIEQESPITKENSESVESQKSPEVNSSENIKEQVIEQSQKIKEQAAIDYVQQYPFSYSPNTGYLYQLYLLYPDAFITSGINGLIDDQTFREAGNRNNQ